MRTYMQTYMPMHMREDVSLSTYPSVVFLLAMSIGPLSKP